MVKENSPVLNRLELPSSPDALSEVEGLVDRICDTYNLKDDYYGNILIAITEAVNNAIDHGNKRDTSKIVTIDYSEDASGEIFFMIKDQGDGFDYNNLPDPTDPKNLEKPDGRGIFLMKNLADEVSFDDNGTAVNIKFKLQ